MLGPLQVELSEEAKNRGYFSLNPERGSVNPGATVQVSIAFEPPSPPPPRCLGGGAPEVKLFGLLAIYAQNIKRLLIEMGGGGGGIIQHFMNNHRYSILISKIVAT